MLLYRRGAKWAGAQCRPIRRMSSCGKGSATEFATLLSVEWKQTSNRCLYIKQGYTSSLKQPGVLGSWVLKPIRVGQVLFTPSRPKRQPAEEHGFIRLFFELGIRHCC
jgi:hypothetical protein